MTDNDPQPDTPERPKRPSKQVAALPVEQVRAKTSQVRKSFSEIEALANSIRQEGQIQPIVVSPQNSEGYYLIQQGERRWRACQQAGIATVEAIINDPKSSELDEIAGELIENIQREALSPLEIAKALHCFVQQGWQQKAVAERLGKTSSFVSTHLSLLKMADSVVALYQANITRDTETLNNLRQLYDLDPQLGQQACQAALEKGMTRHYSRELLNAAKQGGGKAKRGAKRSASRGEIQADQAPNSAGVMVASRVPVPLEPPSTEQPVSEAEVAPTPESANTSERLDMIEYDNLQARGEMTAVEALPPGSHSATAGWRRVSAEALRIIVNILSDTDFQQGVLMTDRVDQQTSYGWVKICPAGQERLVRVPLADIELIRLEVFSEESPH